MYASVHADPSARVLVSRDHGAAGIGGSDAVAVTEAITLPAGTRLITLARQAEAIGRSGRARPLGRDRLALGAVLPRGYVRLLCPAYQDDPAASALDPLPYAAVAAGPDGEPLAAAAKVGTARPESDRPSAPPALRAHPSNPLARQLARCARDNACVAAAAGVGGRELPVPIGAPLAERPRVGVALRSGYEGAPVEPPAFRPSAAEIVDVAAAHLGSGGGPVAFGRACDGEPLERLRLIQDAAAGIRGRVPGAAVHLETAGTNATALRRAIAAGVTSVTIRFGSAVSATYDRLHGPVSHRWSDVRASLEAAADLRVRLTVALLLLPGLTDRAAETEAIAELLDALPGGTLELRDLGCDPIRTLAAFPHAPAAGMRALLDRLAAVEHFRVP